jgi:hypothetical protein
LGCYINYSANKALHQTPQTVTLSVPKNRQFATQLSWALYILRSSELSNRPFKELTDQFTSKLDEIAKRISKQPKTREEFNNTVSTTLYNLNDHLVRGNGELADIVAQKNGSSGNGWVTNLSELRSSYGLIYNLYQELVDKEKAIHRIERKAHTRALIFRFLTTLAIGAGVLIIYFIAQKLEIAMPLLRISA